jgi:hypothetical protein
MARAQVCFDPRDPSQTEGDILTWRPTENPALIRAAVAVDAAEKAGASLSKSFWDDVAREADEAEAQTRG